MSPYEPEPEPCDRTHGHPAHDYVRTATQTWLIRCPGRTSQSRNLAELLARRPELADVTAVAVTNRLAVAAA